MARRVLALFLLHLLFISVAHCKVTPVQKVIQTLIHDMGANRRTANTTIRERTSSLKTRPLRVCFSRSVPCQTQSSHTVKAEGSQDEGKVRTCIKEDLRHRISPYPRDTATQPCRLRGPTQPCEGTGRGSGIKPLFAKTRFAMMIALLFALRPFLFGLIT